MAGISVDLWTSPGVRCPVIPSDLAIEEVEQIADRTSAGLHLACQAELAVNPADGLIGVFANGRLIGSLPEAESARYRGGLLALEEQGIIPRAPLRAWWAEYPGWAPAVGASHQVTLAEPHLLLPLNGPPAARHLMLPLGVTAQVTGEEDHLDALRPWIRPEGSAHVHATLHGIDVQRPRSRVRLVEVRIDSHPVGLLSKTVSTQMLPLVDHLADASVVTACQALVKGNVIAAEVEVKPRRPSALSNEWLNEQLGALTRIENTRT